jgi:FlaA1/EpsC-like NDP-sugar epimerase
MIQLAGRTVKDETNPGGDIEIVHVGTRPGEKMFEELFYDPANAEPTSHPKILRARARLPPRDVPEALELLGKGRVPSGGVAEGWSSTDFR